MVADIILILLPFAAFFGPLAIITAILEATIWKDRQ